MTASRIALLAAAFGVALILIFAPKANAAEPADSWRRQPFAWALERCIPDKGCEVRWLFHERTACDLDLVSDSSIAPSGTRFSCLRVKAAGRN